MHAPLSRAQIVAAALQLLDRDGLAALSMRRLATELGTGAASLYWHVRNKEELLELVLDAVLGEVALPDPDDGPWPDQVAAVARDLRRVLRAHRDVARLAAERFPVGPQAVRAMEGLLAILRRAGLPDRAAAHATFLIAYYTTGFVLQETAGLTTSAGRALTQGEVLELTSSYLAALPADRFSNVVALADELTAPGIDERFEFGLRQILVGLAHEADGDDG